MKFKQHLVVLFLRHVKSDETSKYTYLTFLRIGVFLIFLVTSNEYYTFEESKNTGLRKRVSHHDLNIILYHFVFFAILDFLRL